jgi:hypothetical protein
MLQVSRDAAGVGEEELVSYAVEQSKFCLSVQQPLNLTAIYLSRAGVVGSAFAAALTQS